MKIRLPVVVGVVLGVAAGLGVLGYMSLRRHTPGAPMLPDQGGPVRGVVMQYARGSELAVPVFKQYLQWQDAGVTVYMACPGVEDYQEIVGMVTPVKCKMVPVYTGHEQTAWSRDRWVALTDGGSGPVTLLSQKGEMGAEGWPPRAGDSRVGEDLARVVPGEFRAVRSGLFFDGGDYLADDGRVFVTRGVLERNVQHTVTTKANLIEAIGREVNLRPVLLEDGPGHHAGMFMMSAGPEAGGGGKRVMVVADPSLGKGLYAASSEADGAFTGGPDFSAGTQAKYDAVARVCEGEGYKVVRIPVVPAAQGKMYMTYVNVILDQAAGKPVVYMSSYSGQEKLNSAGRAVWESLGYEVRPIDVTSVWQLGGTLHCLVNVFRRDGK